MHIPKQKPIRSCVATGEGGAYDPAVTKRAGGVRGKRLALGLSALLVTFTVSNPAYAANCKEPSAPGADWSDCNKKLLMLGGIDLEGGNLVNTDFTLTDLRGANLTSANLEKATLVRSSLAGARANKANFAKVEAYRSSFAGISAEGASFNSSELQRTNFSGAKLTGADFEKAELGRANFDKAVITGTRFPMANLSRATFSGSSFEGPLDFTDAFMFLTRIEGVDLSAATGLEQEQVNLTCGDSATKLPQGLTTPTNWPCPVD